MPPNAKGGKGYKKGKHATDLAPSMLAREDDQMYGRVLRSLGNRRFRVYCNDGRERICRLCGSLRKSDWVEEGKIVMLSLRDIGSTTASANDPTNQVGDILAIIDPRTYNKVRKEDGMNPLLFTNVQDPEVAAGKRKEADIDDIFDRSEERVGGGAQKVASLSDEDDDEEKEGETPEERKLRVRLRDQERALSRTIKITSEVDIDAI